jgi:hypothetical protein
VSIEPGTIVNVLADCIELRAAPSSIAVVRSLLSRGTQVRVTDSPEKRDEEVWWPVEVAGVGSGWIPESAITDAALGTVTPSPDVVATATPRPLPTSRAADSNPTALPTPDRDISAQVLPLLEFLPTQDQMPVGMILADQAERSKAELVAALGGTDEAAQLLDDWGWSGNAFRDFIADETNPSPNGTTFMNVSVHRFADAEGAANALIYLSDQVIFGQGVQEVAAPAIGGSARLLVGAPDGVPLAVLYAQQGPIVYRIGGSSSSADSDPTADVLTVAQAIIPDQPVRC